MIRAARQVEIAYFRKQGVYTKVPRSEALRSRAKIIQLRWGDTNKGDLESPNVRARLVGKEFRTDDNPENFAATPVFRSPDRSYVSEAKKRGRLRNAS